MEKTKASRKDSVFQREIQQGGEETRELKKPTKNQQTKQQQQQHQQILLGQPRESTRDEAQHKQTTKREAMNSQVIHKTGGIPLFGDPLDVQLNGGLD